MAKLGLTRIQIINEGLALAGRPDLTSNARLWLNLFLEEFYYTQDVEWLVKTSNGLSVTNGVAFPSDYRAAKSALIQTVNGAQRLEIINSADLYDEMRRSTEDTDGIPTHIYANHDGRTFHFLPAPISGLTLDLKYYYIPSIGAHTSSADDATVPKWELPNQILIESIKQMAMEYNDDARQNDARQILMAKITQARLNARDVRAGSSRIQMGKRFKKRF